jgi:transglutaminase-like putative cysteine protease
MLSPEYGFLEGNKETMRNIMRQEQLQAVNESIHEFFGPQKNNFTLPELFQWQNQHLTYSENMINGERPEPFPTDILEKKIGKCGEFAILFTAACICAGYDARIVAVINSNFLDGPHQFCEVKLNGTWTQVDSSAHAPSELVVNNTTVYQGWGWWPLDKNGYSIFAFDTNNAYNITNRYV